MPLYASEQPWIAISGGAKKKKSRSHVPLPPRNSKTGRFMKRSRSRASSKSRKSKKSRSRAQNLHGGGRYARHDDDDDLYGGAKYSGKGKGHRCAQSTSTKDCPRSDTCPGQFKKKRVLRVKDEDDE